MVDGGTVQVTVSIFGDLRTIPVRVSDTLFRIGQQAIANAIRHASPSNLNICLSYENSSVQLVIESSIPNASTQRPHSVFDHAAHGKLHALRTITVEVNKIS